MIKNPSKYQQALFDEIQNGHGSIVVQAVAGSGKTSSIVHAVNLIPTNKSVIMLAFNRDIAEVLRTKVTRANTDIMTLNGCGHRAWMRAMGRVELEAKKTDLIIRDLKESDDATVREACTYQPATVRLLVDKAKTVGLCPRIKGLGGLQEDTLANWESMVDYFGIDADGDIYGAIIAARQVLERSVRMTSVIDFSDQFFMPLIYNAEFKKYDVVMVDETQDVSNIQRECIVRMMHSKTRGIFVGDSKQSIYGFRGANPDSMDLLREQFQAKTLPLSITYRCSKAVVREAQKIVPAIEPREDAPEGEVAAVEIKPQDLKTTDMVLCRNNAPLIRFAYECIAARVGCVVKGRDIGTGLVALVDKLSRKRTLQIVDFVDRVQKWLEAQCAKARAKDPDADVSAIQDKAECLYAVIDAAMVKDTDSLKTQLYQIFGDPKSGILTLSTVHRSKGLEAENVYVLNAELLQPQKYDKKPWQVAQTHNLLYVCITRAKRGLYFFSREKNKKIN